MAHHHGRHGGSSSSSSEVHGSENYVWNTSSYLGRGATAVVYKGAHKATGEPAAIKTFTTDGFHRPQDALTKELEILQKLKHENVVKLLAIEEEVQTRNKVVIMELCAGGSLYHILDDPENSCGLVETEFLLVLEHLTAGMKYLRGNIISHRDLKPGNIVKFIKEDGSHIYKLTDFGAARAIEDDEQFTSLCGTEEYLNPDIYEKAVMKDPENKTFRPNVDLWSMGATIYHVATGSLPFRPYRGRDNRAGMHFMLRNKASGVISAVQHENGEIEWSKELPKTCLLSVGLRRLITPLIAGLLESRQEKVYSFNKFFQEVEDIIACKPFHLFDGQHCAKITLYAKPTDKILDIQHDIAATTGISIEDQLLFTHNNQKLDCKNNGKINDLMDLSDDKRPILLLNRSSTEIGITKSSEVHGTCSWNQAPISKFPVFDMNVATLDHDAFKAKNFTSSAYTVRRRIVLMLRCYHHLNQLPKALSSLIEEEMGTLIQTATNIIQSFGKTDELLKLLAKHYTIFKEIVEKTCDSSENLQQLGNILKDKAQERETISIVLKNLQSRASSLEQKFLHDQKGQLFKQWEEQMKQSFGKDQLVGFEEISATYVKDIRDAWKALAKFREMRRLSFHDEQFHQLEKIKMKRSGDKIMALWQKNINTLKQANKELNRWYSLANVGLVHVACLTNEIRQVQKSIMEYERSISKAEEECGELLINALNSSKKKLNSLSKDNESRMAIVSTLPTHLIGELIPDKSNSYVAGALSQQNGIKGENETKKSTPSHMLKGLQELKECNGSLWSELQVNSSMLEEMQSLIAHMNFNDLDSGLANNLSLNHEGN